MALSSKKVSIEEMKKVIEEHGSERGILGQSDLTVEAISEVYHWIKEKEMKRDEETIRRIHEYIAKKKRMNGFIENLEPKK